MDRHVFLLVRRVLEVLGARGVPANTVEVRKHLLKCIKSLLQKCFVYLDRTGGANGIEHLNTVVELKRLALLLAQQYSEHPRQLRLNILCPIAVV